MKVKQQTLKGFEFDIDEGEAFKEYYTKNAPLIKGHLLILSGNVDAEIKSFLDEQNAAYIDTNERSLLTRKKRSTAVLEDVESSEKENVIESVKSKDVSVYYRTIRSGEAINSQSDLVFFERINSGAVIECSQSVQVFGIIEGLIRCEGEYILLKEIGQGTVLFHGEELDRSQFDGHLKLIKYNKNALVIKEI
jgi:septum site-determining protein MinC